MAVLIALLIPAVQKVQSAALHTQSANNLRQIGLATHGYANARGHFPRIGLATLPNGDVEYSFFVALLPYLEQDNIYRAFQAKFGSGGISGDFVVPTFSSPLDPTGPDSGGSYAANAAVFNRRRVVQHSITDGVSNTIGFGEHYSYGCGGTTIFSWVMGSKLQLNKPGYFDIRRPTFADKAMGDVHPVAQGGNTVPSSPGVTFQVAPAVADCNPALAQAPSSRGMLTCFIDGSVRTLPPSVSETTFWSLVTADGGEVFDPVW
ncbi:MAG: DUF1559 domain-containing protein [Gemmataceae bacterium]|nr:DUF1559 domain-containing protein [Gemmataceae bacterium]